MGIQRIEKYKGKNNDKTISHFCAHKTLEITI